MTRERDLLPWILGTLSLAAVALAVTAVSSQHAASKVAQAESPAATPAPVSPPPTTLPSASVAVAAVAPMDVPPAPPAPPSPSWPASARSELPTGQIWACMTNGVKTFSNNPCGDESSLLEVSPINTMNATPPVRYAHAYPPPHLTPGYNDAAAWPDTQDSGEPEGYENGGNYYAIIQGAPFVPRRRPARPHRPYQHATASAPRKF